MNGTATHSFNLASLTFWCGGCVGYDPRSVLSATLLHLEPKLFHCAVLFIHIPTSNIGGCVPQLCYKVRWSLANHFALLEKSTQLLHLCKIAFEPSCVVIN